MTNCDLTEAEKETLEIIRDFVTEFSRPPSTRELAKRLNINASSAKNRVDGLVEKGCLKRSPGAKTLDLVDGSPFGVSIPIYRVARWMKEKLAAKG